VPTEYHDVFPKQTHDFAASIQYIKPDQIRKMLNETLKDYNTYAFEQDEEWDEDTRKTAKKANENAFKVLLTLFNNLPDFKSKTDAKTVLRVSHDSGTDPLLDKLVQDCESKLQYTAGKDYSEYHEAINLTGLKKIIDRLMTSTSDFSKPSLWPLTRQVR
jgi:hypothetical protein